MRLSAESRYAPFAEVSFCRKVKAGSRRSPQRIENLSPSRSELSFPQVKEKWSKLLPVLFIVVFAFSRIPGLMPANFSVAYAFAFCAGVYFSRRLSWWLPLAVMLATDIALNFYYQHNDPDHSVWDSRNLANLAFNYAAYAALIFLGQIGRASCRERV